MAMNKTAAETKGKDGSSAKKAAAKGSSAKKAAPKKAAGSATKKAAPKKAAGPKLSDPQKRMLERVSAHTDQVAGFHSEKKPEQKVLEALVKHKVIKRAKKHPDTKHYHYQMTAAGKKHLASGAAPKSS